MKIRLIIASVLIGLWVLPAHAQISPGSGVNQKGAVSAGDCTSWAGNGLIQDAGSACGGTPFNGGTITNALTVNSASPDYFGTTPTANAVNGIELIPAATANAATIQEFGVDATQQLNIFGSGTGGVQLGAGSRGFGFAAEVDGGTLNNTDFIAAHGTASGTGLTYFTTGGVDTNIDLQIRTKGSGRLFLTPGVDRTSAFFVQSANGTHTPFVVDTVNNIASATHFGGAGTAPTLVQGAGSGNSGTTTGLDAGAHDSSFNVSFTSGASPTASGVIATVTFNIAYLTNPPHCVFSPITVGADALATTSSVFETMTTTTWALTSGSVALSGATAYGWSVKCEQ